MSFKENLQKKIKIDALARGIIDAFGPAGSGGRIETEAVKQLLDMGDFRAVRERDLYLYILEGNESEGRILVLDNDLAIFRTSAADIALRKSPYVKEMVSIRNIKKILNDTDVVESKKQDSVRTLQTLCIGRLDLSYSRSDIDALAAEGAAALENGDGVGVLESLGLFAELLDLQPAPAPFKTAPFQILGRAAEDEGGQVLFGPMVAYASGENRLCMIDTPIGNFDKEKLLFVRQVFKGEAEAPVEGGAVFSALGDRVLDEGRNPF